MPQYKPIAISYAQGGLVNDKASFNLTDDSFQTLLNAYNFRGRIRRRQGYVLLGRLRRGFTDRTVQVDGVTATQFNPGGTGSISIPVFTIFGINVLEPNASIQSPSMAAPFVLTLDPGGANETILTDNNLGDGTMTVTGTGPVISSATINYQTGIITAIFTANPGLVNVTLTFSYFPSLPVMGLRVYQTSTINDEQLIAFDTRYAYRYNILNNRFEELTTTLVPTTWTGSNSDFFYSVNVLLPNSTNYLFFATNFTTGDPIRYFDGTNWNLFMPRLDAAPGTTFLQQARILVQYRGRVVALNTFEGATLGGSTQFPQRARWSQFGSPLDADAWQDTIGGRGDFIDCPTSESIVTAEFVRDTLIVGFERSTWKLRYTGNEQSAFVWERINRELGNESTFSTVPFDKGILAIGDKSINVCDGNGVEPIDENIPDEVFRIHNGNDGPFRVHGIRDFYLRQVYWTFPEATNNPTFPDRLFVFDYERQSWAVFTDSFTTLGNWQRSTDITWADLSTTTWASADFAWNTAENQSLFPNIVGGNQQGYVEILNQQILNDVSLQISNITLLSGTTVQIDCIDHNMQTGEYVRLKNISGTSNVLNDIIFQIVRTSADAFTIQTNLAIGTYIGLGEIERVFNYRIQSKDFNLFSEGARGYFGYIDFLTQTTENGEVTCEIRVDRDQTIINVDDIDNFYNSVFVTTQNPTYNQSGDFNWQRFYCPTSAQFFNFTLTLNDEQIRDEDITEADLNIEAFLIWISKDGRLVK